MEANVRLFEREKLIINHDSFFFNSDPDAIRLRQGPEWQPSPEAPNIQGDTGPDRVAYVWTGTGRPDHIGDPVVQVHEGDQEGLYTVCEALWFESNGAWLWLCLPLAPKEPCDEDFMRSIST